MPLVGTSIPPFGPSTPRYAVRGLRMVARGELLQNFEILHAASPSPRHNNACFENVAVKH